MGLVNGNVDELAPGAGNVHAECPARQLINQGHQHAGKPLACLAVFRLIDSVDNGANL